MKVLIKYLFIVSLFLNFSEAFRPVSVLLGLKTSATVSALTLALNLVYIIFNYRSLNLLLQNYIFKIWFTLLVIYPIISMLFSLFLGFLNVNDLIYWLSLNTMYSTLMVGACIYALNQNFNGLKALAWLSVLVAFIGFIVNFQWYSFSREVLLFSSAGAATQEELYRPLSFFPNPNTAALSLITYFIIIFSTYDEKSYKPLAYAALLTLLSGMVFLTGSRTSLILIAVVTVFYIYPLIKKQLAIKYRFSAAMSQMATLFFSFSLSLVFLSLLSSFSNFYNKLMSAEILGRMNFFSALISGGEVADLSLNYRTQIIPKYLDEIWNNPMFGYGPKYVRDKIESGFFENVSQNAFVENAIIYGVPYSLLLIFVYIVSYKYSRKEVSFEIDKFKAFNMIILFIFLVSFSVNNLFWIRAVVISLGLLIGASIRRKMIFEEA